MSKTYLLNKLLSVIFLISILTDLNAQDLAFGQFNQFFKEKNEQFRHSINAEIGGRTFIMGSFNYEYSLDKNFSFGCGLGLIFLQRGDIFRNVNGIQEKGKYFEANTSQMIYASYFLGKEKHHLYFTAGLTHFLFLNRNSYPSGTIFSTEAHIELNGGIGYQFSTNSMYYRFTAYVISMPEPSGWFPNYMPWLGITTGFRF
jgi:hypothetical protein